MFGVLVRGVNRIAVLMALWFSFCVLVACMIVARLLCCFVVFGVVLNLC